MVFFWLSRVQNNLVWELVIRILGPLRSKWMGNFWQSKVHFVLFFSPQTVEPCYFMCDFPSVAFVISIYWLRFSVQLFQQLYKSHSEHFILFLIKMLGMCLCATVHRAIVDGNANLSSTINKQISALNFNPLESLKKRGHWKQRNKCGICSFEKRNSFLNCTSLNNSSRFLAISTALDLRTWTVKVVSDKSEMQLQPII